MALAITHLNEDILAATSEIQKGGSSAYRKFLCVVSRTDGNPVALYNLLRNGVSQSLPNIETFPKLYDPHPQNVALPLTDIQVLKPQSDGGILPPSNAFEIHLQYRNEYVSQYASTVNPLLEPPTITGWKNTVRERVDYDVNGIAYTNSAGDSFDDRTREYSDIGITYSQNENLCGYLRHPAYGLEKCVNDGMFFGARPYTVKFCNWQSTPFRVGNNWFARVTYAFLCRDWLDPVTGERRGWERRFLNAGFKERKYSDNGVQLVPIRNDTQQMTTVPYPLYLDGTRLSFADIAAGNTEWLTFDLYNTGNLSRLNLALPFDW